MRPAVAARLETSSAGAATAAIGAFIGSIVNPPEGVQWALLGLGAGLAFAAGWFHYKASA